MSTQPIVALQVLRGIAATAIAILHFQFDAARFGGASPPPHVLEAGVDLFFVISGFVMVVSSEKLFGSRRAPVLFFMRRLIRIVPLYWLITTIYVAGFLALPTYRHLFDAPYFVASYLFIPWPRSDGILQPVVGQGWTLQHEMFFYLLFAASVMARRAVAVPLVSSLLIATAIVGSLVALPRPLAFFCNPIIIEFVFGLLVGMAYCRGVTLPAATGWLMMLAGFTALALYDVLPRVGGRFVIWGVPAALIVAGAALGRLNLAGRFWEALAAIGAASYALYLFHSIPNRLVLWGAARLGLDPAVAPQLYLALATASAIALALLIHALFERPLTRALNQRMVAPIGAGSPTVPSRA